MLMQISSIKLNVAFKATHPALDWPFVSPSAQMQPPMKRQCTEDLVSRSEASIARSIEVSGSTFANQKFLIWSPWLCLYPSMVLKFTTSGKIQVFKPEMHTEEHGFWYWDPLHSLLVTEWHHQGNPLKLRRSVYKAVPHTNTWERTETSTDWKTLLVPLQGPPPAWANR